MGSKGDRLIEVYSLSIFLRNTDNFKMSLSTDNVSI